MPDNKRLTHDEWAAKMVQLQQDAKDQMNSYDALLLKKDSDDS